MKNLQLTEDSKSLEKIYNNIMNEGVKYLKNNPNINAFVLGISGGIDSALTAALAHSIKREALIKLSRDIKIIGRSIPIVSNTESEMDIAVIVGKAFCDDFKTSDLRIPFMATVFAIDAELLLGKTLTNDDRIMLGNIKARTRMILLYHLARKNSGLVLSTDNYSELLMGFFTIAGDIGDLGFLQNLWKTEVYSLAEWMCTNVLINNKQRDALRKAVEAKPTDGLDVSDNDLDQLLPSWKSYTDQDDPAIWRNLYKMVDETMIRYLSKDITTTRIDTAKANSDRMCVIQRYEETHFKRDWPYNFNRKDLVV